MKDSIQKKQEQANQILANVVYKLESLADGFTMTLNMPMANHLYKLASATRDAEKMFNDSLQAQFDEWCGAVKEGSRNMLNLMLALDTPKKEE